jgi:hypothetical protein
VLRYYDPQNGEVIKDFVKYVDGISLKHGIKYYRVDNLMPNPDICSNILTKSGSKAIGGEVATERGMLGKPSKELIALRKQALQSASFPTSKGHKIAPNLQTKEFYLNKHPLERLINHCQNADGIEAARYAMNNISVLRYRRTRPFGDNKDTAISKDRENLYKKQKRGVVEYVEYEFEYNGTIWLLGMERHKANFEQPYYIYKK